MSGIVKFRTLEKAKERNAFRFLFTLVELLVVIEIIFVLLSLLLPSLKKVKEDAKKISEIAMFRQLGTGAALYSEDNNTGVSVYQYVGAGDNCYPDFLNMYLTPDKPISVTRKRYVCNDDSSDKTCCGRLL